MKELFIATVTATGGREGRIRSEDGVLDLALAMPGVKEGTTNPEQLFAAGYAACFVSFCYLLLVFVSRLYGLRSHKAFDGYFI